MKWQIDAGSITVGLAFLVALVYFIKSLLNRAQTLEREQELQDLEFEAQLLGTIGNSTHSDNRFLIPSEDSAIPSSPAAEHIYDNYTSGENQQAPTYLPEVDHFKQPTHITMKGQLNQLSSANLAHTIQDYFEYHGNPQGSGSIKLKDGRTGLVIPGVESEAFLARNLKRFDFIVMGGRDSKAYVVTSLEEFITAQIRF